LDGNKEWSCLPNLKTIKSNLKSRPKTLERIYERDLLDLLDEEGKRKQLEQGRKKRRSGKS
jgi:hypothetical protein